MKKLRSRCYERRHTADVCPTSNEEAVRAMTSEVGARIDVDEDSMVQALPFKAGERGECGDGFGRMEDGEFAW